MATLHEILERIAKLETRLENGLKQDIGEIKNDLKTVLECVQRQSERISRLEQVSESHGRIIWGILISLFLFVVSTLFAFFLKKAMGQ